LFSQVVRLFFKLVARKSRLVIPFPFFLFCFRDALFLLFIYHCQVGHYDDQLRCATKQENMKEQEDTETFEHK